MKNQLKTGTVFRTFTELDLFELLYIEDQRIDTRRALYDDIDLGSVICSYNGASFFELCYDYNILLQVKNQIKEANLQSETNLQQIEIENPYITKIIHILKAPTISFNFKDKSVR